MTSVKFFISFITFVIGVFLCESIHDRNRNCLDFTPKPAPLCGECSKCYPGTYATPDSCGFCRQCNTCIGGSDPDSNCSCSRGCYNSYWGDRCQYQCSSNCKRCLQTDGSRCIDTRYPWHQLYPPNFCYEFTTTGRCGTCDRCFEDRFVTHCGYCKPCHMCKKGPRYINNCTCGEGCNGPFWGVHCEYQCSDGSCPKCDQANGTICHHESRCPNCIGNACTLPSENCVRGCKPGFTGVKCDHCSPSCRNSHCDRTNGTGRCLDGCVFGFQGEFCEIPFVG